MDEKIESSIRTTWADNFECLSRSYGEEWRAVSLQWRTHVFFEYDTDTNLAGLQSILLICAFL